MTKQTSTIHYTLVDEAPALATYSLMPIIKAYTRTSGIEFVTSDISLAGRILANFPDTLTDDQQMPDHLARLGELAKTPEGTIIKLPNISASIPQLTAAITELKSQGYDIPDYPQDAQDATQKTVQERYAKVLGSAVNPVLREGNSDRRSALSVKEFAKKNPPPMGAWGSDSKTHIAYMKQGDFFESEKSVTVKDATSVRIEFVGDDGTTTVLKEKVSLLAGEVVDVSAMSVAALRAFYEEQIEDARQDDVLLSLHLKATMMKVSDPVIFGHAVSVFYADVIEKHAAALEEIGFNVNNGIADLFDRIEKLPESKQAEIRADIDAVYKRRPALAMVDSDKGITNLHLPNNIIVDASVPVVVRDGGQMWGPDGQLKDTKAMIPDRCYATMYQAVIEDCQKNGAFDPKTMGSVSNVGLMAQKAEEYGSHDKTFISPGKGTIRVVEAGGVTLLAVAVEPGDIFRMCQTKDEPIRDWVKLAVSRARATGAPVVFWLNKDRAHHAELIKKVNAYLKDHDTDGLDIDLMSPVEAMRYSLERIRRGQDTISATGNVLRDYLTDLFPILELGTSSRMLSIVPLMNGGGLFETGAGGSAPKHVQQFLAENHLRWDSLGEYLALGAAFEHLAAKHGNRKAQLFAETLDKGVAAFLENRRSPSRKVHELDCRGSHFYFALYWAEALAAQNEDAELRDRFAAVAQDMQSKESTIIDELNGVQGEAVDIGGYYKPDTRLVEDAMRPSRTLNAILNALG